MLRAIAVVFATFFATPVLALPVMPSQPDKSALHGPTLVQSCETECGCEGECEPEPEPGPVYREPKEEPGKAGLEDAGGSPGSDIAVLLARGSAACESYSEVWRIDCLSVELERVAERLPKKAAYDDARAEVAAAAAKLHAIAEANADPARPAVRRAATVDGTKVRTRRPITPVAPARVAEANEQAAAVIDELATTLLRSGPTRTAQVELARVAQAVDSTKVLLRSS